jgi:hypothetical protein
VQVLSKTVPVDSTDTASWGFSPDDDRFVINEVNGTVETVYIYNLAGSLPVDNALITIMGVGSSSSLVFSPSGQYFAFENLTSSSTTMWEIYNVLTGKMVYESADYTFFSPGSNGSGIQDPTCSCQLVVDAYGNIGVWGFSPDKPETSLVYAYLTGQNSVQWELVHLEQPPTENTNGTAPPPIPFR